jgi:hypothetical protein
MQERLRHAQRAVAYFRGRLAAALAFVPQLARETEIGDGFHKARHAFGRDDTLEEDRSDIVLTQGRRDAVKKGKGSLLRESCLVLPCVTASLRDTFLQLNPLSTLRGPFHDLDLLLR